MLLHSMLTTIPRPDTYPTKIVDLGFRLGTKVTIPYLDRQRCEGITLDMHEEAVEALYDYGLGRMKTLAVALKVLYHGRIVHWGPLHLPEPDYVEGIVALSSVDATLRL